MFTKQDWMKQLMNEIADDEKKIVFNDWKNLENCRSH